MFTSVHTDSKTRCKSTSKWERQTIWWIKREACLYRRGGGGGREGKAPMSRACPEDCWVEILLWYEFSRGGKSAYRPLPQRHNGGAVPSCQSRFLHCSYPGMRVYTWVPARVHTYPTYKTQPCCNLVWNRTETKKGAAFLASFPLTERFWVVFLFFLAIDFLRSVFCAIPRGAISWGMTGKGRGGGWWLAGGVAIGGAELFDRMRQWHGWLLVRSTHPYPCRTVRFVYCGYTSHLHEYYTGTSYYIICMMSFGSILRGTYSE